MSARGAVRILGLLLVLGLAASASPAASQIDPLFEGEPVVLPGIEVAAYGGPPWWVVSDADSTVYILGAPGAPVATWDTKLLELRLKGANRLILQPDVKPGIAAALPDLGVLSQAILAGKSTRLETPPPATVRTVGAGLGARSPTVASQNEMNPLIQQFRDDRLKAGLPETRYGSLPLTMATFALAGDVYDKLPRPDLPGEPVEQTAARIAQALSIPIGSAISYGDKDWANFVGQIRRPGEDCAYATLKDLEQAPARAAAVDPGQIRTMTEAWARGDVAPLIAAYRDGSSRGAGITLRLAGKNGAAVLSVLSPVCLRQIPIFRQVSDRWLTDEADAVVTALKTPGKTVVVYRATDLLFVGGVIDQLGKRGLAVKAPEPKDE